MSKLDIFGMVAAECQYYTQYKINVQFKFKSNKLTEQLLSGNCNITQIPWLIESSMSSLKVVNVFSSGGYVLEVNNEFLMKVCNEDGSKIEKFNEELSSPQLVYK